MPWHKGLHALPIKIDYREEITTARKEIWTAQKIQIYTTIPKIIKFNYISIKTMNLLD